MERAVEECIRVGILARFLATNRAEVIAVSIFEYNKEEEEKKLRKEEFDAGIAQGEKIGIEKERKAMLVRMRKKRLSDEQMADLMGISVEQVQMLSGTF